MNKKFILIFIFLVSCTFSDDTSPKNSPMETTVITTAEGVRSTNYLDYREIKLLRAETVTDETIDFLNNHNILFLNQLPPDNYYDLIEQ